MWDTQLRTGKEARRIALAGMAVAVAIGIGGIGFGAVMVKIAHRPIVTGPFLQASIVSEGGRT